MPDTPSIHPEMQLLMSAREAVPAGQTLEQARAAWSAYSAALAHPHPTDMEVQDRMIPTGEIEVPVRIYRPAGPHGPRPCIIYLHGGGFMKGDLDSSDTNAWGYAQETGACVVSVDYRLSPEHPHPAAFDDCYGVLGWVAREGTAIGIDAGKIALVGDSAGGSLAAAVCLAARDRGGPSISAQVLIYPCTGTDLNSASYVENADAPGLSTKSMESYYRLYLADNEDPEDPYARPDKANDFSNLPPAFIHPAEIDPIRDDGRAYASKLAMAGGDVVFKEAKGMIHGFLRARLSGPAAAEEFRAECVFLKQHLGI
jgi:acetyl esterase